MSEPHFPTVTLHCKRPPPLPLSPEDARIVGLIFGQPPGWAEYIRARVAALIQSVDAEMSENPR